MQSPEEWLAEAQAVLDELGVEAVVIGAVAALRYRDSPRVTVDVDLLVPRVGGLRAAFEARGFTVTETAEPGGDPFLFVVERAGARIDILVAETSYQEEAIARAEGGFLTVEDVILHKLIAWRARDRDDISSILACEHSLDEPYIERWAGEWDVGERWSQAKGWRDEGHEAGAKY